MGTDSVIFIRTDGNSKIATGHLVRCLCITQALEKEGKKVIFLVSDEESCNLLASLSSSIFSDTLFSYETRILENGNFDNLDTELPELTAILSSHDKPVLFVDSYYVTPTYFTTLKSLAKLAYMDDLQSFDYDVDLVINYDVIPESKEKAYERSYTKAKKCLLGAEYTPLRPQFQNQTFCINEQIHNILLTTGGSDPCHFCEAMIPIFLSENNEITLHVIIGKLFSAATVAFLEEFAAKFPFLKLHRNVTEMANLMQQCDFAISAAGTTLYELCAIGVPAISFTMADNQIIMAETFAETGAIPYAGDIRKDKENVIQEINLTITKLIYDSVTRKKLHTQMQSLIDGNGTLKIAKALCRLA